MLLQLFCAADFGIVPLLFPKLPLHQAASLAILLGHCIPLQPIPVAGHHAPCHSVPPKWDTSPAGPLEVDAGVKSV